MKKILIVLLMIVVTGCRDKSLDEYYDNMQITDSIDSYQLDVRIYGDYDNNKISDYYKISNYKNEQIIITKSLSFNSNDYIIYDNDKTYSVSDTEIKEVSFNKFADTAIYLEGIKNLSGVKKEKDEKIGDNTYLVYSAKAKKNIFEGILKDTSIENIKLDKDVPTKIWVTKDGYISRIIYLLDEAMKDSDDKLELSVKYYSYNVLQKRKFDPNAEPKEDKNVETPGGLFQWER